MPALLIGFLAVSAILLAVYALRSPVVPDGGQIPGPAPTWDSRLTTPTVNPTPTPTTTSSVAPGMLDIEGAVGLRATRGSCGGPAPLVELSRDTGATWTAVSFAGLSVAEILSVRVVSDNQFDVVAAVGSDCSVTMVSSYTAGEYWQSYPDRVSEATWISDGQPPVLHFGTDSVAAPCEAPIRGLDAAGTRLLVCSGSVLVQADDGVSWTELLQGGFAAGALSGTTSDDVVVVSEREGCTGLFLLNIDAETASASEIGCQTALPVGPVAAVDSDGSTLYVWNGQGFWSSTDGGTTWVAA
ncbi:hypothetical protein [Herbiconiux liangxiaofengii]|uniref:hypothetical protein n=1 Tax=Herbiconiux liangxiaofengii TaxID=3342795 RepID=UPI0035B7D601